METENPISLKLFRTFSKILLLLLVACTTGQCRKDGTMVDTPNLQKPALHEDQVEGTVLVAKPDGSKQCGISPGVDSEKMAKELDGIKILSTEKRSDGLMRIQACGTPTGMHNIYEINGGDLEKAKSRGFKIFKK